MRRRYLVTSARTQHGFDVEVPTLLELLPGTAFVSVASLHRDCARASKGHPVLVEYQDMVTGRRFRYDSRHRNLPNRGDYEYP